MAQDYFLASSCVAADFLGIFALSPHPLDKRGQVMAWCAVRFQQLEILMVRIDDHCKRHPLDTLYNASAALVDELRQ
jgi:hypothetical protein